MTTRRTVSAAACRMPGTNAAAQKTPASVARSRARRIVMTILSMFRPVASSLHRSASELPLGDARQERRPDRQDAVVENVAGIVHRRTRRLPEPEIGARDGAQHVGEIFAGHFRPRLGLEQRLADDLACGFGRRDRKSTRLNSSHSQISY